MSHALGATHIYCCQSVDLLICLRLYLLLLLATEEVLGSSLALTTSSKPDSAILLASLLCLQMLWPTLYDCPRSQLSLPFSLQLVKLCSGMIEAGKAYITTNKHFVTGVRDLSQQCKKDEMISVSLFGVLGSKLVERWTRHETMALKTGGVFLGIGSNLSECKCFPREACSPHC